MKTRTLTVFAALMLAAGFAVAAEQAPTPPTEGWHPGWRHEQMAKAFAEGKAWPGPMMMHRIAGGPPLGPDGKVDTTKLPEWCPMKTTAPAETK